MLRAAFMFNLIVTSIFTKYELQTEIKAEKIRDKIN
jgi:hypothetical protein